jgi:hypothetical protein
MLLITVLSRRCASSVLEPNRAILGPIKITSQRCAKIGTAALLVNAKHTLAAVGQDTEQRAEEYA